MKASELRLNNLVFYDGKPRIVTHIDKDHVGLLIEGTEFTESVTRKIWSDLSPIPLDESWLTRASFNKRSPNSGAFDFGRISVIFWPTGQISIEFKNVELGNISFLHEFQNWFRLLTGEELSFAEVGDSLSQPPAAGLSLDGNS